MKYTYYLLYLYLYTHNIHTGNSKGSTADDLDTTASSAGSDAGAGETGGGGLPVEGGVHVGDWGGDGDGGAGGRRESEERRGRSGVAAKELGDPRLAGDAD